LVRVAVGMVYLGSVLIIPCANTFWLAQLAQEDTNILGGIILKPKFLPETNSYI
jgi:hypothetical protein